MACQLDVIETMGLETMGLRNVFSATNRLERGERSGPTDYVRARLESGAETIDELSIRVRDEASRQATDAAERAVDELFERATGRSREELLADSGLEGASDGIGSGADERLDRALERFLRRYGLDEGRLDDRTLDAIRTRLSAAGVEAGADVDLEELLERALRERSSAADGAAGVDGTTTGPGIGTDIDADGSVDDPLAEACSRLRARLDGADDRSVGELVADLLERDAVAVGHDLERVLTEELPAIVAELEAELAPPEPSNAAGSRAGSLGAVTNATASDGPADRGARVPSGRLGPMIAAAAAVTTLLSEGDGVDPAVAELATGLLRVGDGGVSAATLEELVPLLLGTGAESDFGLDTLRSNSAGSLALVGLFVANLVAMTSFRTIQSNRRTAREHRETPFQSHPRSLTGQPARVGLKGAFALGEPGRRKDRNE